LCNRNSVGHGLTASLLMQTQEAESCAASSWQNLTAFKINLR
jgi:hypothetical protein